MIVSYERRFAFFHIPKTGGTSIRRVLLPYCHDPLQYRINRLLSRFGVEVNYRLGGYRRFRFRTHERASVAANLLPSAEFESLFKFAFVRNPWDQLVSMYKYIQGTESHKRNAAVRRMEFRDFVRFAAEKGLAQQKRLIADESGKLLVDFVGRFENLAPDFEIIRNKLKLKRKLPHLNKTDRGGYEDFYDASSIDIVRTAFRDDIETFQYEFGVKQHQAKRAG